MRTLTDFELAKWLVRETASRGAVFENKEMGELYLILVMGEGSCTSFLLTVAAATSLRAMSNNGLLSFSNNIIESRVRGVIRGSLAWGSLG